MSGHQIEPHEELGRKIAEYVGKVVTKKYTTTMVAQFISILCKSTRHPFFKLTEQSQKQLAGKITGEVGKAIGNFIYTKAITEHREKLDEIMDNLFNKGIDTITPTSLMPPTQQSLSLLDNIILKELNSLTSSTEEITKNKFDDLILKELSSLSTPTEKIIDEQNTAVDIFMKILSRLENAEKKPESSKKGLGGDGYIDQLLAEIEKNKTSQPASIMSVIQSAISNPDIPQSDREEQNYPPSVIPVSQQKPLNHPSSPRSGTLKK